MLTIHARNFQVIQYGILSTYGTETDRSPRTQSDRIRFESLLRDEEGSLVRAQEPPKQGASGKSSLLKLKVVGSDINSDE